MVGLLAFKLQLVIVILWQQLIEENILCSTKYIHIEIEVWLHICKV